jgi:hypothetical protein
MLRVTTKNLRRRPPVYFFTGERRRARRDVRVARVLTALDTTPRDKFPEFGVNPLTYCTSHKLRCLFHCIGTPPFRITFLVDVDPEEA